MNLVLIGLRGTGKTTVAQLLAQRLGWPWFDADAEIEARAGQTIAAIFAADGEAAFRDLESQIVAELACKPDAVLALGGGAVLRETNRQAIAAQGRVVWLTASPQTMLERIQSDSTTAARRPSLSPVGGITEITATLDAREAIYRACAHLKVDTEGKTPAQVADAILGELHLGSG
jgi:shikimate kinase